MAGRETAVSESAGFDVSERCQGDNNAGASVWDARPNRTVVRPRTFIPARAVPIPAPNPHGRNLISARTRVRPHVLPVLMYELKP